MKLMKFMSAALIVATSLTAYAEDNVVKITGNDTMQYDVKAFEVKAGTKFKIHFKNVGKLPKQVMGHNVVVLKPGTDTAQFGAASMTAAATEYIPEAKKNEIVAHTKLLGPGEEETLEVGPLEAGEYPYICSFPGHYAIMKGVITVK